VRKPPVETSGDKKSRPHENSADAPERGTGAAAGEIVQLCLVLVHNDQNPEDRESEKQAN